MLFIITIRDYSIALCWFQNAIKPYPDPLLEKGVGEKNKAPIGKSKDQGGAVIKKK